MTEVHRLKTVRTAKQKHKDRPGNQIPTSGFEVWYTFSALNTSVVLCGPSGAVLDLRLPPPVSSVRFTRNLKQDWQSKPPARPRTRVRAATASASKKVILNVECFRSECGELFGASDGTRFGAIFGNADFSLHQGAIGGGEVFDADSRAGGDDPASIGR